MKPRKTPPKEGAGSGCMARLVRLFNLNFEVFLMGVVIGLTLVAIPVVAKLLLQIICR